MRDAVLGTAFLAVALLSPSGHGAEVRGRVELGAGRSGPVSVALLPLDGQPLPERVPREQVVHLHGQQFEPPYLIARVGDRLRLVNDDEVFHVLVTPYARQGIQVTLSKAGTANAQTVVPLTERQMMYVFCKIHTQAYARVDVVETPLATILGPDQRFDFGNLAPGRWRLRIATRSGDTQYRVINAFTAPPPVEVVFPALQARVPDAPHARNGGIDALFPIGMAQP